MITCTRGCMCGRSLKRAKSAGLVHSAARENTKNGQTARIFQIYFDNMLSVYIKYRKYKTKTLAVLKTTCKDACIKNERTFTKKTGRASV